MARDTWPAWLRALHPHQWSKNLLIVLPVGLAHEWGDTSRLARTAAAFAAFSLVASAGYLVNDLLDIAHDRGHPTKHRRPIPAGEISVAQARVMIVALVMIAGAIASQLSWAFSAWLGVYFASTVSYSLKLKRVVMLDVMILAALYALRLAAGAAAADVAISRWLLAFALFFFLGLALVKRTSELVELSLSGGSSAPGRGYSTVDLDAVVGLGTASSIASVVVLSLYIDAPETVRLYVQPQVLWGVCVLLLYWQARTWTLARRGQVHEDPVLFALRDPVSLVCGVLAAGTVFVAARW
jgi:4-hydroxybenzoate polyprenyltransferase